MKPHHPLVRPFVLVATLLVVGLFLLITVPMAAAFGGQDSTVDLVRNWCRGLGTSLASYMAGKTNGFP